VAQIATQKGHGLVRVEKFSTTVRHVWSALLSPSSGTFVQDEALTWPGGGVGVVTSWVGGGTDRLRLYRTAGPEPVATTVISAAGSGASGTVSSFENGSPPDWVTVLPAGLFPKGFRALGGPRYELSSTINGDNFVLTGAYQESTTREASFAINQDFSGFFGFPTVTFGDAEAPALLSEAVDGIDAELERVLFAQEDLTPSGGVVSVDWLTKAHRKRVQALAVALTVNFTAAPRGPCFVLVVQIEGDSVGGPWAITWPASVRWLSTAATSINASEVITVRMEYDGTNYYAWAGDWP
jgi:hypothetical protein